MIFFDFGSENRGITGHNARIGTGFRHRRGSECERVGVSRVMYVAGLFLTSRCEPLPSEIRCPGNQDWPGAIREHQPFCRNISASLRQAGQSIAADASTTNVLRRELVGEYYEILAIPSGAGDQQAVEPEEMGGVTNRLSALAVEFAITTPSHAERLDRRRVCELQGTRGA